jgi:hypothetical protein
MTAGQLVSKLIKLSSTHIFGVSGLLSSLEQENINNTAKRFFLSISF